MRRVASITLALAGALAAATLFAQNTYEQEIAQWRQEREADLKGDNSWLTVAGLFFLNQGKNSFGSGPLNDIVLPADLPPDAGVFEFDGKKVTMRAKTPLAVNGKETTTAELRPAGEGRQADVVTVGGVSFFVHMSGDRLAIRLRDKNSEIRRNFTGLKWFPPNAAYKVTGRFEPYATAKTVKVPNILGDLETYKAPGVVAFNLNGQEYKLEAFEVESAGRKRFFFVFRDLTSGKETYPSARFLYSDLPVNGKVTIDFNKAYNPYCAYNSKYECPFPPPSNRLKVPIRAGEKAPGT